MAQHTKTPPESGSGSMKAIVMIGGVFGFLALAAAVLFLSLKLTQPKNTLMGTTAGGNPTPQPSAPAPR